MLRGMNKTLSILSLIVISLLLTQCRAFREIQAPDAVVVEEEASTLVGLEGFREICSQSDTVNSVLIKKAEALFMDGEERYEAQVSIYAIKDSLIYLSAVNSGFEIIRASVSTDTIRVIDRINKVVYSSAVNKRFGHQNPFNFDDIQYLVSRYFLCDRLDDAKEVNFFHLAFNLNEPETRKDILLDRETLQVDKFEFINTETGKYFMGERNAGEFKVYSNFMMNHIEIVAKGGELVYNQAIEVQMEVNRRKYAFMNF
jgi:hypothetical protein